jgi:hypothetical protein
MLGVYTTELLSCFMGSMPMELRLIFGPWDVFLLRLSVEFQSSMDKGSLISWLRFSVILRNQKIANGLR